MGWIAASSRWWTGRAAPLMRLRESARPATPSEFELRAAEAGLYAALQLRGPEGLLAARDLAN
ncbi:MAG TPA: hypothetical protein VJR89_39740 [Polyangiales bacterium]|nr:hypothetical protein [Polyangiales bacterium]